MTLEPPERPPDIPVPQPPESGAAPAGWIPPEANPYAQPDSAPGPESALDPWAVSPGGSDPWAVPTSEPVQWPQAWSSGEPAPAPGVDGFAVAAFVLALLSLVLFAVGFAIAALRRTGRTHRSGRGLAIAALVVSGLWVVVGVTALAVHADQPRAAVRAGGGSSSSGGVVSAGQIDAGQVRVGDCVQEPSGNATTVATLEAVPCSAPHDDEAYYVGNIAASGTYPGDAAVTKDADAICGSQFQAFVGIPVDQSALDYEFLYPGPDQWQSGDYSVTCFVTTGGKSTGSLRDARR